MNTETTNQNHTPRSSRTLVWIVIVALGLTAGAGFALLGGGDDDAGDEALKEMLNNFDVGNLDSLGFEFDPNGQSR